MSNRANHIISHHIQSKQSVANQTTQHHRSSPSIFQYILSTSFVAISSQLMSAYLSQPNPGVVRSRVASVCRKRGGSGTRLDTDVREQGGRTGVRACVRWRCWSCVWLVLGVVSKCRFVGALRMQDGQRLEVGVWSCFARVASHSWFCTHGVVFAFDVASRACGWRWCSFAVCGCTMDVSRQRVGFSTGKQGCIPRLCVFLRFGLALNR